MSKSDEGLVPAIRNDTGAAAMRVLPSKRHGFFVLPWQFW